MKIDRFFAELPLRRVRHRTGEFSEPCIPDGFARVYDDVNTDCVIIAPRLLAWLYRLLPRGVLWNPPSPNGPWVAPGIFGATWLIGYVRASQYRHPERGGRFVAHLRGRFYSWPNRGQLDDV